MNELSTIILAAIACYCTYEAVWRVVFIEQWKREQMEFLREKFGSNVHTDDDTISEFWTSFAPAWIAVAVFSWILLAAHLSVTQ